jgi:hypothetical protein
MKRLKVDKLTFEFPDNWTISKYDDWRFYTQKFQSMCGGGIKGMDILALDPQRTAWLIEVKDYRQHRRTKAIEIAPEVADKAFDTLAGLLPAKVSSDEPEDVAFAKAMHNSSKLRIVLHLEQPTKHSALFPRAISLLDVQQKLRTLVRPVDAHAVVCEMQDLRKVPWNVVQT